MNHNQMNYIGYETRCFPCLTWSPDIIVSEMICGINYNVNLTPSLIPNLSLNIT